MNKMDKPYASLPKSDLAVPEKGGASGSYPVNSPKRAKAALGLVGMHGTSTEKAEVRAKVAQKYPDIKQNKGNAKMIALKRKAEQYGSK